MGVQDSVCYSAVIGAQVVAALNARGPRKRFSLGPAPQQPGNLNRRLDCVLYTAYTALGELCRLRLEQDVDLGRI